MYRSVIASLSLAVLLLSTGHSSADDLSLTCSGTVDSFKGSLWTKDNEEIGARLNAGRITFFGNKFLSGENVKICADAEGDVYFDNECNKAETTQIRRSGTFDKMLMILNLSNTGKSIGVNGYFTCKEIKPAEAS